MNQAKDIYQRWRQLSHKQHIAIVSILVAAIIVLIPIATYAYFSNAISSKENIMNRRDTGVTLLDRHNKPFFYLYQAKSKSTIAINTMPVHLKQALIATEDQDYYKHPGFSLKAIAGAMYADIMQKELTYGGSTITQQLVKISLLTQNKNFLRKYQEIILAAEIDRRYSKDEVLEMYLNSVYLGEGAFGVEAASQTYFGKPASALTLAEASLLIGILPAPSAYSPVSGNADLAKKRQLLVLERMTEQKYITEEQEKHAAAIELHYRSRANGDTNRAHHFAMMVKEELVKRYGEEKIARSGYKVTTSLDLDWQAEAETALRRQLTVLRFNEASNGAVVALDPRTGEIRSLVG
ncbi:MAG TPA: transglycosylase domain-containing protein, partial [Candidatus Saccharimonadia bacterium]